MSVLGPIIPPQLAGVDPRSREADKARERKKPQKSGDSFQRALDEAEISAPTAVEATTEVRSIKANDAEESREDHTASAHYDLRGGAARSGSDHSSLDIKG